MRLNSATAGPTAAVNSRNGGTRSIAACSGPASAMLRGTISPSSMCATTTSSSATTSATGGTAAARQPEQLDRVLQQPGDRGLAEAAEQQREHGDRELGRGEHLRQPPVRAQHGAGGQRRPAGAGGEGVEAVAPRGDQGELGTDEERVACSSTQQGEQSTVLAGRTQRRARARSRSSLTLATAQGAVLTVTSQARSHRGPRPGGSRSACAAAARRPGCGRGARR